MEVTQTRYVMHPERGLITEETFFREERERHQKIAARQRELDKINNPSERIKRHRRQLVRKYLLQGERVISIWNSLRVTHEIDCRLDQVTEDILEVCREFTEKTVAQSLEDVQAYQKDLERKAAAQADIAANKAKRKAAQ